jgi:hypothetical protein
MNFAEKIWNDLFGNTAKKSISYKGILKRSRKEILQIENWKQNSQKTKILNDFYEGFQQKKQNSNPKFEIHLISFTGANGLIIFPDKTWKEIDFIGLLEYLKEKLVKLSDYFVQNAEINIIDKKDFVETTEKYYLKPNIYNQAQNAQICNQQFGNITLEYQKIDLKPSYIKILASFYDDHLFTKALPFDELILFLLNENQ